MLERPSPNHGARRDGTIVDILVLHYTGMADARSALDRLCDPSAEVSAHYLVEEDGVVWRLVPEDRRAWHAGVSSWAGEADVNSLSIGIELVNPGHGAAYRRFALPQMIALERLCHDILARHPIPAWRILGHSDVAPGRKRDPGELFDWKWLADRGVGLWPDPQADDAKVSIDIARWMRRFGYPDGSTDSVAAFQRHFRPRSVTGVADDETRARLVALVKAAALA